jgi:glycosyltransferase involved in cell wall biosynthesis
MTHYSLSHEVSRKDIVLFSTADWESELWTNKQHVASELARLNCRVLYVEGVGLRDATLAPRDRERIKRRCKQLAQPLRKIKPSLHVLSLPFFPRHGSRLFQCLNRLLISTSLAAACRILRFRNPALWTYHPLTSMWINVRKFEASLYHCVDNMADQPGMPKRLIESYEQELASSVTCVVTTSPSLERRLGRHTKRSVCFHNAVDFEHFSQALRCDLEIPIDLRTIPLPRVGFVGALSGYKVDFQLLIEAARLQPHISFVLIGPIGLGEVSFAMPSLPNNIYVLGAKHRAELPAYLKGLSVGLLPYKLNAYTEAVFPMKFFEYLAAGLSVVATDLDALRTFSGYYKIASSPQQLCAQVAAACQVSAAERERGRILASNHTYRSRTAKMLALIEKRLSDSEQVHAL